MWSLLHALHLVFQNRRPLVRFARVPTYAVYHNGSVWS